MTILSYMLKASIFSSEFVIIHKNEPKRFQVFSCGGGGLLSTAAISRWEKKKGMPGQRIQKETLPGTCTSQTFLQVFSLQSNYMQCPSFLESKSFEWEWTPSQQKQQLHQM